MLTTFVNIANVNNVNVSIICLRYFQKVLDRVRNIKIWERI